LREDLKWKESHMHISIYHDWHNYDYECSVSPKHEQDELASLAIESTESDIRVSKIVGRDLYLIELWGGSGPRRNEFHIVDDGKEAFASFKGFLEECCDYVEEGEVDTEKVLNELREKIMI